MRKDNVKPEYGKLKEVGREEKVYKVRVTRKERPYIHIEGTDIYSQDKLLIRQKKAKKKRELELLNACMFFNNWQERNAEVVFDLNKMTLIEAAQFYVDLCYFPNKLICDQEGFRTKQELVDSFYNVFTKLPKSKQQFIENRFQFEVEWLAKSQKMEIIDRTILNSLLKKETTANTLIKDTLHYVASTSIGDYQVGDTFTTSTNLSDQVADVDHSKEMISREKEIARQGMSESALKEEAAPAMETQTENEKPYSCKKTVTKHRQVKDAGREMQR